MRRFLALLTLPLIAASPAPRQQVAALRLASDAENRWVPFEMTEGNQIRFAMTIDGRQLSAVLDTGVSFSALSRAFADRAHWKVAPRGQADAIGGVVPVGWVGTKHLTLGALSRTGGGIIVVALPALVTGSSQPIDLLVGRDLIGGYALDVDYDARRFRLLPSGQMPFRGATAPLSISRDRAVYISELTLGDRRLKPMIVDTGDGASITLSAASWKNAAITPAPAVTSAISFGLGGSIETDVAILPEARIGELHARNVEIRIEGAGGFSETTGSAGRIGSAFLQRYRVLFDPAAGRMIFSPGRSADQPPTRSTSGLLLGYSPGRLRVLHVMRGGPAATGGWKSGELICTVDGAAVPQDKFDPALANWTAGTPGRAIALGMCDGTNRMLTLKNFY